jgi:DNA-binding transcriptional regulator YiaG
MTPKEVAAARAGLGMTLEQLADALRLDRPYGKDVVRSWEKGRRPISGPAAVALRYMLRFGPLD